MASTDDLGPSGNLVNSEAVPDVLGPFDPPEDYTFEEEFEADPPRPRTADLRMGRYATRQRRAVSVLLISAALLTASGLLPIVKHWGLYLLPLQYVTWIGCACGVLAILSFSSARIRKGPYLYVESGIPLVARIRALTLRHSLLVNDQPSQYRFYAQIEYRHPAGNLRVTETSSNDISSALKHRLTTTYRVGDYVTAVYLQPNFEQSLRLYGFLDLKPGLGLIRRNAEQEPGLLKTALLLVSIFALFGTLFWNVYAFEKFEPVELGVREGALPFSVGAVILGGGVFALAAFEQHRRGVKREERNRLALATGEPVELDISRGRSWIGIRGVFMGLILVAGALVLGGATTLCWTFTANAMLDHSPPRYRPIQIDRMISVTHSFLFREYKIEYHFLDGDPKQRRYLSTPYEMIRFRGDTGIAEIHSGYLRWPWVKSLAPLPRKVRNAAKR
jgi:hypothetical protein